MSSQDDQPLVNIIPGIGTDDLRLGMTSDEVERVLIAKKWDFNKTMDPFSWSIDEPELTLDFVKTPEGTLVLKQMLVFAYEASINGMHSEEDSLDEYLLSLGVKSFQDTLWSGVSPYVEYAEGTRVTDAEQVREKDIEKLFTNGTLWIKSMGLGLHVSYAEVDEIAVCLPDDVPRVGCGSLTEEDLVLASDPEFQVRIWEKNKSKPQGGVQFGFLDNPLVRACLIVASVACVLVPTYLVYQRLTKWSHAKTVSGVVVAVHPEGPFPEVMDVEYRVSDSAIYQVPIPFNYTVAREVGNEVELWYREQEPQRAMTRMQMNDDGWESIAYVAFGGLFLSGIFWRIALPKRK